MQLLANIFFLVKEKHDFWLIFTFKRMLTMTIYNGGGGDLQIKDI